MATVIIILLLLLGTIAYFLVGSRYKPTASKNAEADAQRFARLLISEIKLYETYKFERGLKTKNLYESLKYEIEEAREKYQKRCPGSAFSKHFDEALVNILANGDENKLGLGISSQN